MKITLAIRILALLLTLSTIMSFVGCGTNNISTASNGTAPSISQELPSSTESITSSENIVEDSSTDIEEITPPPEVPAEPFTLPESTLSDVEADEFGLTKQQRNSFSMLYHLAITAEEIRISKDNRLLLDEIYTSLLNDINPGAIDETTQDHLKNLRDIIKSYINISVKRDRLQYIYNQDKAATIRSAVPNPLAVLSTTNSFNWKRLVASVAYTVVDSYNNYKGANEAVDQEFLMSGWELDDEETATIQKNRERAFDYMVDIVQEYGLDGQLTLNEKAIETFAEICAIESVQQKIRRLESEERTYNLLGNYWLELADCYYETSQYRKCLDCVDKYKSLATGIYRKDYNYVQILPKAIVAAQKIYSGNDYISNIEAFADSIIKNTDTEEWAIRYFAAQVYLDLYSRTDNRGYLEAAYNIAYDNVTILLDEQQKLNTTYLEDVKKLEIEEPDYRFLTPEEKAKAEQEYKNEQKRLKTYNNSLKKIRETELPPLYEPLVLNCDLLFGLANEMHVGYSEKANIEAILQTDKNGVFLIKPINDRYSFSAPTANYSIDFSKDKITIPANLLYKGVKIVVEVTDNGKVTTFNDCAVTKVERKKDTIDSFYAQVSSKQLKNYGWTADSKITVKIFNDDNSNLIIFCFKVVEYKNNWLIPDKVVFGEE